MNSLVMKVLVDIDVILFVVVSNDSVVMMLIYMFDII